MLVNGDFSKPALVLPADHRWVDSPQPGVSRVMLDRVGAELARATSLVRYVEGSAFPRHGHPGGEEILVLSGVFSDETGDFPAGWYLRNPPGTAHVPSSAPGATIFVKLMQMSADDRAVVRVDTRDAARWTGEGACASCPLFDDGGERVTLERLPAGAALVPGRAGNVEVLVIEGGLVDGDVALPAGSWLRRPAGDPPALRAGSDGATVYLKSGHPLPDVQGAR